jgi:hypothetical protein
VTLTFDRKKLRGVDRDRAAKETLSWLKCAGYVSRCSLAWVYVVERGKNGRWHGHVLFADAGAVNWRLLEAVWQERNGRLDVRPVYNARGVSLYTTKSSQGDEVVVADTVTVERFPDLADYVVVQLAPTSDEIGRGR